jgi:hypothetical protein
MEKKIFFLIHIFNYSYSFKKKQLKHDSLFVKNNNNKQNQ